MGKSEPGDRLDYEGLARWVAGEMTRQQLQPKDIKANGGPAWPTLNEILKGHPRPKREDVLRRLSLALSHPADAAYRVLHRLPPNPPEPPTLLRQLVETVEDVATRVEAMERLIGERLGVQLPLPVDPPDNGEQRRNSH